MRIPEAAPLVLEWLAANEKSQQWLANEIESERESLWRWLNGKRAIHIKYASRIERLTGVPAVKWDPTDVEDEASSDPEAA